MGSRALLQRIFPIQGSNQCLLSPALAGGLFTTSTAWEAPYKRLLELISKLSKVAKYKVTLQKSFVYLYIINQFSCSVLSNSLQPHGLQHDRLPCPSPTPRVYSNSCPLSWWCHPTISSSVVPFSSHPQSFPVSGSFQMSQFFKSGDQSIGVSALAKVLPMNIQDWFPLGWTGWSPCNPRDSQGLLQHQSSKALILRCSAFFTVQLSHPYMTTGKTIAVTRWIFVGKVMSLLFNMLSRLVITFLPRTKHFFHCCNHHLQWFWSPEK